MSRRWEQVYGARLAAIGPATLEWYLPRRLTKAQARALALELHVFAPEGNDGTVEDLAAQLTTDARFSAWWD